MKYILKHSGKNFIKKFTTGEDLEIFLSENNWTMNEICNFFESKNHFGWSLEIIPTNNKEKFQLLWDEVSSLFLDKDYDDDLTYFVNNNFQVLAVDIWQNCGASQYDFSVNISKLEREKEFKEFENISDSFTCKNCNHVGFYDYDESVEYIEYCYSCGNKSKMMSYRNYDLIREKLKDIA